MGDVSTLTRADHATSTRGVPLARDLARFGDRAALVTDEVSLSYHDLAERVAQAGHALGAQPRLVLMEAGNDVSAVVLYLAALAHGHPLILAPSGSDRTFQRLRERFDPDVVATSAGSWEVEGIRPESRHDLHPDLALLISTSGSTGSPRLVRLSADNVQSNAEAIATYLGISAQDRAISTLPLSYCYGLSVLHSHLVRGASVVLTTLSVVDECFWELFERERVTSLAGVPHTFRMLDRVGFAEMRLPSLRFVTQAGGRLDADEVRRYADLGRRNGFDFVVMYGQTEATARMAYLPPHLALSHPDVIGMPIPGGEIRIVEPAADSDASCDGGTACKGWGTACDAAEVAASDVGELVYSGPNVMLGYAEDRSDLRLGRTVGHLHTGDLARRTQDGLFQVVGRASRFVKVLGLRVDLGEVESALREQGVDAACAQIDDALAVVCAGDVDLALLRTSAARASGLPESCVRVRGVDALPRLESGKVDMQHVGRLWDDDQAVVETPSPTSASVQALRETYAGVLGLGLDEVQPASSFVALGGDSMTYVALSARLERVLGGLPRGWHTRSIQNLVDGANQPFESGSRRPEGRWRRAWAMTETSAVLRAVAIALVVGTHAGAFYLLGGAHLLVALAGYNLARFQLSDQPRLRRVRHLRESLSRIVLPSLLWMAVIFTVTAEYGAHLFFANTFFGANETAPEWRYWFVESLVYLLVVVMALAWIPALDRWERRWPLGSPLVLLTGSLLLWWTVADDPFPRSEISPGAVAWLFALGWAFARATRRRDRVLLSLGMVAAVPFMYDDLSRWVLIVGGLLAVAWLPSIPIPRVAARAVAVLAGASLFIYLTHYQVYPLLDDRPWSGLALSLVVGIALWWASERVRLLWRGRPNTLVAHPPGDLAEPRPDRVVTQPEVSEVSRCSARV